jgi:hypothetical protein
MRFKTDMYDRVRKRHLECFQPYDRAWSSRNELNEKWTTKISSFFHKTQCCAMCGVVKLLNRMKHYKTLHNMYDNVANENLNDYMHYGMANLATTPYTSCNNTKMVHLCINCHSNKKKPLKHILCCILITFIHGCTLLSTHPLHLQLLSFLDISMHMESRN